MVAPYAGSACASGPVHMSSSSEPTDAARVSAIVYLRIPPWHESKMSRWTTGTQMATYPTSSLRRHPRRFRGPFARPAHSLLSNVNNIPECEQERTQTTTAYPASSPPSSPPCPRLDPYVDADLPCVLLFPFLRVGVGKQQPLGTALASVKSIAVPLYERLFFIRPVTGLLRIAISTCLASVRLYRPRLIAQRPWAGPLLPIPFHRRGALTFLPLCDRLLLVTAYTYGAKRTALRDRTALQRAPTIFIRVRSLNK
ncbi:hypothetical protein C8J57DRAFT_156752 [Mycena rebaudengoi]|nr:hypothetical protein C8J57DRAFT_156752 [Mycena rebaudengoi]